MVATHRGHDGCLQLLLDKGAQVKHQNKVSAYWDQPSVSSYHVPLREGGLAVWRVLGVWDLTGDLSFI